MSGFFGDLSKEQEAALREMKGEVGDIDDHTLLRFLRARQFQVKLAVAMYKKYVDHRKSSGIDRILKTDLPKTDLFRTFVPHAYHGFDKDGRPLYIEKVGAVDYDTAFRYLDEEDFMRHHLYQMELQIERCKDGSQKIGHTVDNSCMIIDLAGLSMSHRRGLKLIRMYAAHDQDFYPERLGRLYIINAPWVFPTFWRLCKVWLDQNTINKIHVLGKNFKKELLQYIPAESLPAEYGGTCNCNGGCCPVRDISQYKGGAGLEAELNKCPDMVEKTVAARDVSEVKLSCGPEGGNFQWCFRSAGDKDIEFSVQILAGGLEWSSSAEDLHDMGKKSDGKKIRYIVEPERTVSGKGSYNSRSACTILIKFDNSHSYFTSKSIKHSLHVGAVEQDEEKGPFLIREPSSNKLNIAPLVDQPLMDESSPRTAPVAPQPQPVAV